DPGNDGRTIFVIMAPAGLTLFASATGSAAQRLLAAPFRLALVASGVVELIGFDRPLQPASSLVGQGCVAQPPAPAVTGAAMNALLPGDATGCTRQAEQKRGANPVHHRALAAVQERTREIIEGACAALFFAAVAFESGLVVVRPPGPDVVALTPGTLQRTILPAQTMDIGAAGVDIEELVQMRQDRHG